MKIADFASQPEAVRGQPATLVVGGVVAGVIARLALFAAASLAAATSHLAAQPSITVRDSIVLQESGRRLPCPAHPRRARWIGRLPGGRRWTAGCVPLFE